MESKELALPKKETALDVYSKPCGLDPYLEIVRNEVDEFKTAPPALNTDKGRAAYKSMARKIASFKTALDKLGKEVNDDLKALPKRVDVERKRAWDMLESWQDEILSPLNEWQKEQDAKALAIQVESDHEIALLMYADFLRKKEDDEKATEQARIDNEARIAKEAADRATKAAQEAAEKAILDAKMAKEFAEREKLAAEAREKQAAINFAAKELAQKRAAELAAKQAEELAERARLQAIKDTEERIEREKMVAEAESAKLAANKANQKRKNNEALEDLMSIGFSADAAMSIVVALAKSKIRNCSINY